YGEHAKWFFDLPEPDGSAPQLSLIATLAARAVSTAMAEARGPVHLNWPFRDPLIPVPAARGAIPLVRVSLPEHAPSRDTIRSLAAGLSSFERGLLAVGPQD